MRTLGLLLLFASNIGLCHAHGDAAKSGAGATVMEETAFGRTGEARSVSRTIDVVMNDRMRFTPSVLHVRQGETIRLRIRNSGRAMHELVIGTREELRAHAELMRKHPGMEHDAPYMAHVAPGKTGTVLWQFTHSGEFYYGCLVPGHFEAGMMGRISVTRGAKQ